MDEAPGSVCHHHGPDLSRRPRPRSTSRPPPCCAPPGRSTTASAPSLCAGWTRGHVLTHLARNADGLAALVRSAVDGTGETMYTSPEARDADIEAGAGRSAAELVADVERTARALAEQLPRLRPEQAELRLERTPGQFLVKAKNIPFMRLREVVFHHVDLARRLRLRRRRPRGAAAPPRARRCAGCAPPTRRPTSPCAPRTATSGRSVRARHPSRVTAAPCSAGSAAA